MNRHHSLLLLSLLALGACRAADYSNFDTDSMDMKGDDDDASGSWTDTALPPEVEDDFLALSPAQTDLYVFVANPSRDTVTRIQVYTQAVDTTPVGRDPRLVRTTRDYRQAVVFNRGDDSVTLIDAATLDKQTVPVRDNLNQLKLSPDSGWAVLWHDLAAERADDPPPDGIVSLNEVSFVRLSDGAHFPMAVGFNPKDVVFTPSSTLAVVVTDTALAAIDLTVTDPTPKVISIAADPLNPPPAEEVVLSPDGKTAFVRQFGASELVVVDLDSSTVSRVLVGANPTDLDLSPDGTRAIALARGAQQLWIYDVAAPLDTPQVVDLPSGESFGSLLLDPSGKLGLLYTNAALIDRYASWDIATDTITVRSLVKPVRGISITPNGASALVLHTRDDAADASPEGNPFYGYWAVSVIGLDDFRANPLRLPGEITGYANGNTGDFGYFIMKWQNLLEVLDYRSLLYTEVPLKSEPVYVGVLPDLNPSDDQQPLAWVSQDHPLGRMTFYDPNSDEVETITGFELNAQVEQ